VYVLSSASLDKRLRGGTEEICGKVVMTTRVQVLSVLQYTRKLSNDVSLRIDIRICRFPRAIDSITSPAGL
jgi:hypothetical protein